MCQLIETIAVQNGEICNLSFHQVRCNKARKDLFQIEEPLSLQELLPEISFEQGLLYKFRILYDQDIREVRLEPYEAKAVTSLKLIEDNEIAYAYKYANRERLNALFALRGACDNIVITQNGFVTDTAYSNIIFWDGADWITPATPLLEGTMRSYLLAEKMIREDTIRVEDLSRFVKARMINAMLPLEGGRDISVEDIVF